MDNAFFLRRASYKKQAIIEYASRETKVYYFPDSLIDNEDCEMFLSVWRGGNGDIIKLNIRMYSDIPDYEKHALSLSFGTQKKTLPLGEACGVPVMSNRKEKYVTRFCTDVPLSSLFEINDEKELFLTDGVSSKKLKLASTKTQRTKLALFLASCIGLEQLNDKFKGLVTPLIEQEEELIHKTELKEKEEKKRQIEEAEKKALKEKERAEKRAEDAKKREKLKTLEKKIKEINFLEFDMMEKVITAPRDIPQISALDKFCQKNKMKSGVLSYIDKLPERFDKNAVLAIIHDLRNLSETNEKKRKLAVILHACSLIAIGLLFVSGVNDAPANSGHAFWFFAILFWALGIRALIKKKMGLFISMIKELLYTDDVAELYNDIKKKQDSL